MRSRAGKPDSLPNQPRAASMTSVEKPTTDALNVELPGKQGCFQLLRLAAIGIHHNGVAPYRQHIQRSTQCRYGLPVISSCNYRAVITAVITGNYSSPFSVTCNL